MKHYTATPTNAYESDVNWVFRYVKKCELVQLVKVFYAEEYTLQEHLISNISAMFVFTHNDTQFEKVVYADIKECPLPDGYKLVKS